jgi:predicted PurR-regulated permease PerM
MKFILKLTKKTILITTISLAVVILIAVSAVVVIKNLNNNTTNNTSQTPTKESADNLKSQSLQYTTTNPETAKSLLNQAKQQYQELNDTDNVVDTEALLFLLDHSGTESDNSSTNQ